MTVRTRTSQKSNAHRALAMIGRERYQAMIPLEITLAKGNFKVIKKASAELIKN